MIKIILPLAVYLGLVSLFEFYYKFTKLTKINKLDKIALGVNILSFTVAIVICLLYFTV